jgi:hypothetical protein
LDSSVVISAERLGQTAYQMLEVIGTQAGDPEIAVSVTQSWNWRMESSARIPRNGVPPGSSFLTICWLECQSIR